MMTVKRLLELLEGSPERVAIGCAADSFAGMGVTPPVLHALWSLPSRNLVVLAKVPWVIHYAGLPAIQVSALSGFPLAHAAPSFMVYCRTDKGGGHAILHLPVKGWTPTHRIAASSLPGWYDPARVRALEFDAWAPERWAARKMEGTP